MGDYRYNKFDARKIKKVLFYPNNIRYILDGKSNVSYAESELFKVENVPEYRVKKIIDKRKEGRKIFYLVWWDKCLKKDATWEPRRKLIKDVPELIKEYDRTSR